MKITKGVISKDEARRLAPDYVKYRDIMGSKGEFPPEFYKLSEKVLEVCNGLKRGQSAVTCDDGVYVKVKVTSVTRSWKNEDGPVVRVGNGEWTWRVDGCDYAWPLKKEKPNG